jgi:NADPH:quinone reductase-like Zn-dependent oxidoreductase
MKSVLSKIVGGPDALSFEKIELPPPRPNQLLIDVKAIGVIFFDGVGRLVKRRQDRGDRLTRRKCASIQPIAVNGGVSRGF